MAIRKFNAYEGISVGDDIITYDVIDNVGNVTANHLVVNNTSNLGAVGNITITGGTAGYILSTDGAGNLSWANPLAAGVAGLNTEVQFNNAGSFGNSANFTFNRVSNTLSVTNILLKNANVTGNVDFSTASNVTLGNLATANYFSGDGYLLSNITGGNVTGTVDYANYATYSGTVLSNDQPNITSVGTLANLTVTGNISSGNANLGNLATANYFSGNGALLNHITGGNVTGQVANALIAGTVYTNAQPNITSVGTLSSLNVSGNIAANNMNVTNDIHALNVYAGNLLAANYFSGDGSQLSNVTSVGGMSNFANYANYAGNVTVSAQPNITSVGTLVDLTVSGNSILGNLANANYFSGNGSLLTNITGGNVTGQVGNALVAGTVYTNAQPNITSVGRLANLTVGNATANTVFGNGTITAAGNLTAQNILSNANLTANTGLFNEDLTVLGNLHANVGTIYANSGVIYGDATTGNGALYVGIPGYTPLPNTIIQASGNIDGYAQINFENINSNGTSDYIATADSGTDTTYYVDLGIAGSTYDNASPNNSLGTSLYPLDSYLYAQGNTSSDPGGNLVIGTTTASKKIKFIAGGVDASNVVLTIANTGITATGNSNLGNSVTANYLIGNGSAITGLTLANSLTDVTLTSPTNGQILGYNGVNWVNVNNSQSVSAGAGVTFYFGTPVINTVGANSDIQVDTLNSTPNTSAQTYASVAVNGTAVINGVVSGALNRTVLDAGNWDFSIWANITSTSGTNTINCGVHQVLPNAGTVTVTGTGTSRTATASSGTPFATVVAGSDVILSSYLQLPHGLYRVTAKTSDTVVTINVPSTYTNETTVAASVWIPLFNVGSLPFTSTSFTEYFFGTTQPSYNITTGSAIGVIVAATTSTNKTINITLDGTTQASHVLTPLHTLHDDLAGLQGGQSNEYYHLTNAEYTGTGTGNFVRQTSPQLTTPNIDSATGTSLVLTGNITSGNAKLGNLVTANYFSGDGGYLSNINVANIGTVANANYAAYAGNVVNASQSNITSLGTLSSLTSNGTINFTNASNVSLGDVSNVYITGGADGQILVTDGTGNLQWVDNDPTTVTHLANSITLTHGVYVTGDLYSIQVFGDYNEPDGVYVLTDGTGSAPAWWVDVDFVSVPNFNRVVMNINYTLASGHTIYVQLYNYATSFSLSAATVTTTSGTNIVTVSSTANMAVGQIIIFGTSVGGLTAGTPYYILSIPSSGQLTVGTIYNATNGTGTVTTLSTDSQTSTVDIQNWDIIGSYTGLGAYYAFALQVVSDTNYIDSGQVRLRLDHANQGNASHQTSIDYVALELSSQGPQGPRGPTGATGNTGPGVASGGTTGQVLVKNSGTNYDTAWTSTLSLTGNITVGNASLGNLATANYFDGNLTTATQSNITTVGTLSSLTVTGNISSGNANLGNLVVANYFSGDGGYLSNLQISSATVANANYANYSNYANFAGQVIDATQANITSVGTLSGLDVSGNAIITGNLTVTGTTIYANVTSLIVKDPIIEQGGNPNGVPLSSNDGKDRGSLLHYYTTSPVDAFMGWDNSNGEFILGSNVSVSSEVVTVNTYGNVRARYFLGNGSQLTGTIANANYAAYVGDVVNASQPNITSLGTLTSLSVTGNISSGNANLGNLVTANYFTGNGSLLTGIIANSNYSTYAGTVVTNAQPNITSVGTLASLNVTGNVSSGANLIGKLFTSTNTTLAVPGPGNVSGERVRLYDFANPSTTNFAIGVEDHYIWSAVDATNAGFKWYAGNAIAATLEGNGQFTTIGNITAVNANLGNLVTANYVSGTLTTSAQPNITSTGTLTSLTVTGNITGGNANLGNLVTANYFSGDGGYLSNLQISSATVANANYANYAGNVVNATQSNITSLGTLSSLAVSGNVTIGSANKNQLVNLAPNILEIRGGWNDANGMIALFAGDYANGGPFAKLSILANTKTISSEADTFTFHNKPNNATLMTVSNSTTSTDTTSGALQVSGGVGITGNLNVGEDSNLGNLAVANYFSGDGGFLSNLQISSATVANANYANYAGNVVNAIQSNITSVGTLDSLSVTGNITSGNADLGNLVAANYFSGDGGFLSNLQVSSATVANANYANYAGQVVDATQSNITSLGTLASLTVSGNITSGNANLGNLVVANYVSGDGSLLYNLNVANIGTVANANYAAYVGNVINATQSNITSLGTLTGLTVSGNITSGNANLGNLVVANYFSGDGGYLSNLQISSATVANANYANYVGQVIDSTQSNITSLGTLSGLSVSGNATITGNLTVTGTTIYANVTSLVVKDPIIEMGGNPNGDPLTTDDGKDRGTLLHYYNTSPVDAFMGWDTGNAEFGFGSNVSVLNDSVTFNTYGNLRASYFLGNGSQLTGTIANANYAAYAGNVINASQSNITSLGTLTTLTVTGNITGGNASLGNLVVANYFSGDGGLLSNINVSNIGTVANANFAAYVGNVVNAIQSNITAVGTLSSLTVTGNVTAGNASLGNLVTASYFSGDGYLLSNITGANVTGTVSNANYAAYAGNVVNATQSNITSVGRLTSLTVGNSTANTSFGNGTITAAGNVSAGNANLGNLVVANYFSGDGGLLSNIQVAVSANYANYAGQVVDATQSNITSLGRLTSLRVGNATANTLFGNGTITAPGNISAGNANLGNLVVANYFSGDGGLLSNLQISSATVANANYANFAGTVVNAAQSNITSLGTLSGLTVSGNITGANASLGNLVTANYTNAVLTTGAQPNITSLGSLTGITVSNASGVVNFNTTANISLGAVGNLHISGGTSGYVLRTDGAGNLSWIDPTTSGAAGSNTQVQFNNNSALAGSANFTFNNTSNTLTVDNIVANGAGITYITGGNVSGQVANALIAGTVYTNAQPNITSLGTLSGINLTGAGNANLGNLATANYFSGNGSLLTSIAGGNVTGQVGNALIAGTVYTGAQPNITSVGTVSGLTVQSTGSISGANSMTANYFTGVLTTPAQPNITSLGTLTSVTVSGTTNLGPIGNVTITGGSAGYVLTTNGSGGLSWQAGSGTSGSGLVSAAKDDYNGNGVQDTFTLSRTPSGTAAVQVTIDGLVQQSGAFSLSGADIIFSSPPANGSKIEVTTYGVIADSASNTQVYYNDAGNLGNSAAFTFNNSTNTLTVTNFTSSGNVNLSSTSNVSLGAVANIHITGGTSGYVLTTNGSGGLSWSSSAPSATTAGTVTTNAQPNITSLGTLSSVTVTGNVSAGNANLGNLVTANYFTGNGSLLTSITGGNVTGQVGNALIAGTVYTNAQPNITSVGTLTSLSVTGNVSAGNANLGNLVTANYFTGNGSLLTSITGANVTGTVANATYAVTAGSTTTAGTVTTNAQPNITSLGTLSSLTVTGNVTAGNANLGNLVVANYFSGDGSLLSAIAGGNVNGTVANANYAAYAGNVVNASQSNITSLGTLTSLTVTGNVSSGNANLGNLVTANYFTGTLTTAAQPNITSVGTLTSLTITGNVTAGNARLGNLVTANYFSGDGGYLSNLQISSATVANANLANFAGNVINPAQPNITSLGTLTSLTASGNITAGNANLGNLVTANYFSGNASLMTGVIANANYAAYAGNVVTASQPNITSLGTLTSLSTGDTTVTGNLTVTGTTIYANVTTLNVKDPVIEMGGNPNGTPLSTNDGKDRGTLLHYYVTGNSTAVDAFMGWDNSNAEFAFGSNVTNSSEVMTFNNFGNVRASYFLGNGSQLTGVIANANYAAYAGNVVNASQSNITSLGTLTSLTVSGNVTAANANLGNLVTANYFTGNGSLLTSLTGGNVTGQVGNALIAGTVYTNAQPNITSVGTLTSLNVTGNISSGNANLGNLVVANYFSGDGGYLSNLQISSATVANANYANFAGNVINAAQANITSLGTLTGLTSGGTVNFTTASNVSLGAVGNLHVTGGSNHNVLQTNGSGTLSWGALTATVDSFTGNGVQTDFTLSITPASKNLTMVNYNGAILLKADYSLAGAVLTISSAPYNGSKIEVTTFSIG